MQFPLIKILNMLRKLNTPLAYAIFSAVFGLALLFLPDGAVAILFMVCGVILALFGTMGIIVTASDKDTVFRTIGIIKHALLIAIGISLYLTRTYISPPLCHAIGLGIAVWSLVQIYSIHHKSGTRDAFYYIDVVISSILAILGVLLLITPTYLHILAGITLLLLSIKLAFNIYQKRREKGNHRQDGENGVYYINDFVDKSNEP